ncbi:gem-associated protein 8 isoform X1 [Camelus bactrianus]|uniref:gem-associated protein 8 isoform X1 n=1 Tax=Camelus bactrianus TaxID=9837 RepID=UPI003D6F0EFC
MAAKMASTPAPEGWASHPVYARYWQHYHQAMAWMRSHQNAYRKAVESFFSSQWYRPPDGQPPMAQAQEGGSPPSYEHQWASWDSHGHYSRRGRPGRRRPRGREEPAWAAAEEEEESESDGGIECDVSNMEITEELRQYFAQTERHREERREWRQQELDAARLEEYVNADHDLYCDTRRSVEPPSERPGERRQAEMQRLYGAAAAKIQAMEAAVQLSFDKHCDRKQPKYWPVIPLKF